MKKFITVLSVLTLTMIMSFSAAAQYSDYKVVTGDCTIVKQIRYLRLPQVGFPEYEQIKEESTMQVKIEWHSVGDGGRCTLSLILWDGDTREIETWRNYDDLKLMRCKTPDGQHNYMLASSMFGYFILGWMSTGILGDSGPAGYVIDTALREID